MGQYPDPVPLTAEQKATQRAKVERLVGVLSVFWGHHGRPSEAEAITQANQLYAQLYPGVPSIDCVDCVGAYSQGQS